MTPANTPCLRLAILFGCLALLLSACASTGIPALTPAGGTLALPISSPPGTSTPPAALPPTATSMPSPSPSPTPLPDQVRFAVIGDYGWGGSAEAGVANLVHAWQVDLVLTVGDNNYPFGASEVIDEHIGQFYQDFIFPYSGLYGVGADQNRFFPSLGNHDWYTTDAQPYLDYFTLPGNERYYEFTWGPVHFFALDSDENEPDGVNTASLQATWLKERLAVSDSPWQVVYFHYPPYSSAHHGSTLWLRWPFAEWGADAVLSGHDHVYERLLVDGIPYFINGCGGAGLYNFNDPLPESQFRYNALQGAMLVNATSTEMLFEFYNLNGDQIDAHLLTQP